MSDLGNSPLVGIADDALLRILLVEDDEDDYVIIRDLLSEIGEEFELEWVADYDAALQAIEREEHDVCLLDYRLGERSGLDLLREAAQRGYKAPMILLTGQGDRDVDLEAMRAGATDYLVKGQIDTPLLERSIRYGLARTLKALGESERRFRSLVQSGSDIITVVDAEGRIRYGSPSIERVLGYRPEDLIGQEAFDYVHPDDVERVRGVFVEAMSSSGVSAPVEVRVRHADGSWRHVEAVANNLLDEPTVKGIAVNSRDVTERKRAEEALRRREAILQAVGFAADLFLKRTASWEESIREVLEALGRATQVSRVYIFENYTGEYGTLFTRQRYEWVAPGTKPEIDNPALQALPWRDAGFGRWLETLSQGQPIFGHVRDFPESEQYELKAEGIQSIAVVPIFVEQEWRGHIGFDACLAERDWSAAEIEALRAAAATLGAAVHRNRTEEALRQSEERFRRLVEQAADAIFVHDLEGKFVEVNQQACESLGYAKEELLSMSVADIEENFDPRGLAELWDNIMSDGATMIEGIHRRKDGTRFPVEIRVGSFETGEERLVLAVARDTTERKRAEQALRESEERYRAVVQQAAEGMFLADLDTKRILEANDAYRELLGYSSEEMLELTLYDVVAHDQESIDFHVQQVVSEGSHVIGERQHRRKDGSLIEVEVGASLISYGGRNVMSVVVHDITERRRAEEELRKSEARNRAILEATPDLMFRVSRGGEYLDFRVNDDSKLYVPREEIVGKDLRETMPPELVAPMLRSMAKTLDTGEMQVFEYQLPMAEEVLDFEARLVVSGPEEVLSIVRDVTERKALERRLEHQAFHDALTGLPNRALFIDRLEHALVRAERRQEESVAVLFMDLDNFKIANDSLGHEAGDQLLVAVAERLRTCLRPQDTLARLGGDEFTILLEDIAGSQEASLVAERAAEALREPFEIERQEEVFVTASIGIAFGGSARDLPGLLLRNADLAMYQAKDKGKARYEVFDPGMNERLLERMRLESELRRALEKNELRVYYQPKFQLVEWDARLQKRLAPTEGRVMAVPMALPTPRLVGAEALVRWDHPERGLVPPHRFVPMAEETGLIVPIGRWVLREACRQARQWQESHPSDPPLTVSVNLSAREFQQHDLAEAVAEVLGETGLDPYGLEIEITESTLMEETQRTIDTLRALKDLGVQLSIDDFGTGYSSLSYLTRFPVDGLKMDKSFIDKLGKSYEDTALVSTTISLSHAFGLKVVAEGLETADQLRRLRELGCDQAQGYYFARPLSSRAVSAMLGTDPEANTADSQNDA